MSNTDRYSCQPENAQRVADWLAHRGGIFVWKSINLSNPGGSWTTPARTEDGQPYPKPTWQAANEPDRHITDPADVDVTPARVVKRFHVAIERGDGLQVRVTSGGSARIRRAVAKAEQETGKQAWYGFDYEAMAFDPRGKNCVIYVEDERVPLLAWLARQVEVKNG